MTGYTALMQDNEHLARQKRKRFKDVLDAAIAEHDGKVLQNYGDGSLTIFNSVINSVNCAISIQQQLQLEPKVELRIGIHTGDVVMEDDSISVTASILHHALSRWRCPVGFLSQKKYMMK